MTAPADPDRNALRVELLGTGGYHPSERRHTACVLLPNQGLMLDAGTAAFRVLERVAAGALPSDRLDVVLTHAHLDHIVGVTFLFGLACEGRPIETVVHAPPEALDAVREHLLAQPIFPIDPVTRLEPLAESLTLHTGAKLTTFPLDHPGGSVGVRVEAGGKSLAYVTDTRPLGEPAIEAVRGADVLLHEAYFDDSQPDLADASGHCRASDAARFANAAGVGRLVMMHVDPRASEANESRALAEARAIRPDAEYGVDGMVIEA